MDVHDDSLRELGGVYQALASSSTKSPENRIDSGPFARSVLEPAGSKEANPPRRRRKRAAPRHLENALESEGLQEIDASNAHLYTVTGKKRKRLFWSNDMHRRFMGAVFDIGLQTAKPRRILDIMSEGAPPGRPVAEYPQFGTEHIKSHLQKYREKSTKSRAAFLQAAAQAFDLALEEKVHAKSRDLRPGFHAYPMGQFQSPIDTAWLQEESSAKSSPRPLVQPGQVPSKQHQAAVAQMTAQVEMKSLIDDQFSNIANVHLPANHRIDTTKGNRSRSLDLFMAGAASPMAEVGDIDLSQLNPDDLFRFLD